ncbi:PP2C family protein-serine/threonine phosphatase [Nonomuraea soli]|uniref:Serine phosphatase RsbU (Regulator of sigma subunit) n=1 Tax=Nonomuraea soli TaxID=1032476 RepID=A0A7W0HPL0_9ACTN|nr:PP2C family protein-serine/threonine phosphatase [Nonomuraea soli]MBA2890995.1 serine phosphatase RsbU (regulator of sigma subunit) [Nonomuraea soli]
MATTTGLSAVYQALRAAPPYALPEAIRDALQTQEVELLLADYAQVAMRPVLTLAEPGVLGVRIDNGEAGRAFASQQSRWEKDEGRLHLPVTADGDRLGVLCLGLEEEPDASHLADLEEAALALGHALRGADRVTDRYQRARRLSRLTLAAEMQWGLLPGTGHRGDGYRLAGQLEPAYAVYGDNFDWACDADTVVISVTNGMGEGMRAALLSTLAVTALRNARRSGADLEEQAGLADEAVYAQYGGREHVSTLLLRFDVKSGELAAVDAGSPKMLRLRGTEVEPIELDQQLPLGMFGNTRYQEQHVTLQRGDRIMVVSDGVAASRSSAGSDFGESMLESVVRSTRLQPADEAVRTMIRGMLAFREGMDVFDDAVVVCLDWTA